MKYFIDLEFIESGHGYPIDLISIGIVAEDGREFYAISTEFTPTTANDWVVCNVLLGLPPILVGPDARLLATQCDSRWSPQLARKLDGPSPWKNRAQIRRDIVGFIGNDPTPEFWGEWCSYDWVVFCQIFGTMMHLPAGFPMRCNDVVQYCETHLGISTEQWPESLETDGNHNALLGAKTVKARWEWCESVSKDTIAR